MPTRIVMVDDHDLFRDGLRSLVACHPDVEVVGEAADAEESFAVIAAVNPCVVVMDVSLPGMDGIVATREVRRIAPGTRVLILTMHADGDLANAALAAGASGFALKDQRSYEIIDAIRAVVAGGIYKAPRLAAMASGITPIRESHRDFDRGPFERLSSREREVFELVVRGYTNENVGAMLAISVKTVQTHRAWINRKLGAHSTADLVRLAAAHGLLQSLSADKP